MRFFVLFGRKQPRDYYARLDALLGRHGGIDRDESRRAYRLPPAVSRHTHDLAQRNHSLGSAHRFVDIQIKGPYREWIHEHILVGGNGGTIASDHVEYSVMGGTLVNTLFVWPDIERTFAHRHRTIRKVSADHRVLTVHSTSRNTFTFLAHERSRRFALE